VAVSVLSVDDPPAVAADSADLDEDSSVVVDVVDNDSDVDGDLDVTSLRVVTAPADGAAVVESEAVRYTPDADFYGADSFVYEVCDLAGLCDSATVTLTVRSVDDAPAVAADSADLDEDSSVVVDVVDNDSDVDGDLDVTSLRVVTAPADGAAVVESEAVRYTPANNYFGGDSFVYEVCDLAGLCDSATVTLMVRGLNDDPVAVDDAVSLDEDTSANIDVLENDTDVDDAELMVEIVVPPVHGVAEVLSDQSVRYVPAAAFRGADGLTYRVCDSAAACAEASVTITVVAQTEPPTRPVALAAAVALPGNALGSGQVQLSWLVPASDGGSAITDYVVQFRTVQAVAWLTFVDGVSPTTSALINGLANGQEYRFRVVARNEVGDSEASESVSATPRTVPGAPTALAVAVAPVTGVGSGQVRLTWAAPSSTGGAPLTGWIVQRSTNGVAWTTVTAALPSSARSYTAIGLANGTRYYFRVIASNAAGNGAASSSISTVPRWTPSAVAVATPAVAPTSGVGSGQVRLSWTVPTDTGGSPITGFVVQRSTNQTTWTTAASVTASMRTYTATGLTNGTRYYFRVIGRNAVGNGPASATVSAIPRWTPSSPRSVTTAVAPTAGIGTGQVRVSWAAPSSTGGSAITGYVVQRSSNGRTWSTAATVAASARSYTASGLTNGTRYYFRVVARNAVGNGPASATVSAIPRWRPSAPRSGTATPGHRQVRVSWAAPSSTGGSAITGYIVQRSTNGTTWTNLTTVSATARSYNATGLTNGTRYYFRVIATNAVGNSPASTAASAIPR
jgi:hypothetical protein